MTDFVYFVAALASRFAALRSRYDPVFAADFKGGAA